MDPIDVEQYRALVEYARIMVWRSGGDGQRDYFNATWLAFTGRSLERETGKGWADGIHPEDRSRSLASYDDHFELRQPFEIEYRLRRFDGVYRYVSDRGGPYLNARGAFGGFLGLCTDLGDRRSGELPLDVEDFFGMSLDNLCVVGFDGYFKRLNPSWTRTLGWSVEELMSKPSIEFVHPDDRELTLAGRRRLHQGGPLGPLVNRYLCKDGGTRWLEWSSVGHGERGLVYAAARDVTEQKRAQEQLHQARKTEQKLQRQLIFSDRMASVGTLAAGAAHEINNPLSRVTANLAMILEELAARRLECTGPAAELREMVLDAQAGAERIRQIILGLMTFSRAEEDRRAIIDLRPVLELAIDLATNEVRQRASLVTRYGKTPLISADSARLGQVFINLLVNAAQSLPEDGGPGEIRVVTYTDLEGRAVIEVQDTGPGIPAAIAGRIFDPFFTTKPIGIGTGLGLSICHNIVTDLGGEIGVVKQEERGATFRVALPAASAVRSQAAISVPPSRRSAERARVLVVDDQLAIGVLLRRVLRGHDVEAVSSARQALGLLDSGQRFDVILSDLMMPEMSGMGFYEELRRRFPQDAERVVFMSGGAFTPTAKQFLEQVPNQRLEKPFDPQHVREIVQRFIK